MPFGRVRRTRTPCPALPDPTEGAIDMNTASTRHTALTLLSAAAAAFFVAVVTGCATGTSTTALPDTPVGQQLAWVIGEVNGSSGSLADAEVARHLAPTLL